MFRNHCIQLVDDQIDLRCGEIFVNRSGFQGSPHGRHRPDSEYRAPSATARPADIHAQILKEDLLADKTELLTIASLTVNHQPLRLVITVWSGPEQDLFFTIKDIGFNQVPFIDQKRGWNGVDAAESIQEFLGQKSNG